MISQRLRGVKEDGEAIDEADFMPKLQKAFGDAGVAIQDDNGELRSTYDILSDLAGVWDTLSSKQRQYLGEKAAGNRQVKVLNAIMANWDVVQKTIGDADNSAGVAMEGNEKFMEGIQGRITKFQSAFQDLSRTTINSGLVKDVVYLGTAFLNLANNIGGIAPLLTVVAGAFAAIKAEQVATGITAVGTALKTLVTGMASGIATVTGFIGIATVVISIIAAVSTAIENNRKKLSDYKQEASDAGKNYSDQQSKLKDLNSELKNTQEQIATLQSKGPLTIVEKDELARLQGVEKSLERQITLQEELSRLAQQEAIEATAEAVKAYNTEEAPKTRRKYGIATVDDPIPDRIKKSYSEEDLRKRVTLDKTYNPYGDLAPTAEDIANLDLENLERYYKEYQDAQKEIDELGKDANAEQIKELEEKKNQALKDLDETKAALKSYAEGQEEILKNVSQITDPKNEVIKSERDFLDKIYTGIEDTIIYDDERDFFNAMTTKYKDAVDSINDELKSGTKISGNQLFQDFPEMTKAFEDKGWTREKVAEYFNAIYEETQQAPEVTPEKDTSFTSIFTTDVVPKLYETTDAYKNLTKAMQEQQKAGVLSNETVATLLSQDEQLIEYLTLTADGYALNTDAAYDYLESMNATGLEDATYQLGQVQAQIEALEATRDQFIDEHGKAAYDLKLDGLQAEQDSWGAVIRQIQAATGELARYKAAKSSSNQDADFNAGQGALKDIKEGLKSGKVGTDDFSSAIDFMLGDGWEDRLDEDGNRLGDNLEKTFKMAKKKGERYFGDDEYKNVDNFTKDLVKKGFAQFDENGNFSMLDTNALDGSVVTIESMAAALGTSYDAVKSLFGLLETYDFGDNFEFPEIITDDDLKSIEKINQIKEAQDALDKVKDRKGDISKELSETDPGTEKYAELEAELKRCDEAAKLLEERIETLRKNGDEGGSDQPSIEDALKQVEEITTAATELQNSGIDIPITLSGQYEELVDLLAKLGITGLPGTLQGNVEDKKKSAAEKKKATEKDKPTVQDDLADNYDVYEDVYNGLNKQKEKARAKAKKDQSTNDDDYNVYEDIYNHLEQDKKKAREKARKNAKKENIDENSKPEYIDNTHKTEDGLTAGYSGALPYSTREPDKGKDRKIEPANGTNHKDVSDALANADKASEKMVALQKEINGGMRDINKAEQFFDKYSTHNVDLKNRPLVPGSKLNDVGWDVDPDSYATILGTHEIMGENGEIGVVITPILPNGDPLEPGTIDDIFSNLLVGDNKELSLPEGFDLGGFDLSDILISQIDLSDIPEDFRGAWMEQFTEGLHAVQESYYDSLDKSIDDAFDPNHEMEGVTEEDIENLFGTSMEHMDLPVTADPNLENPDEVGQAINDQVSEAAEEQPEGVDWSMWAPEGDTWEFDFEADATDVEQEISDVEGEVKAANPTMNVGADGGQVASAVEQAVEGEDLTVDVEADTSSIPGQVDEAIPDTENVAVTETINTKKIDDADIKDQTVTATIKGDASDALQQTQKVNEAGSKSVTKKIDVDTGSGMAKIASLDSAAGKSVTKTVTVVTRGGGGGEFATGTHRAPGGTSLVDERGAELIEHTKQGTFELGTNKGARFTHLDPGDVVHTAAETRTILSRLGSIGGFFRDGLNRTKSVIGNAFATGVSGSMSMKWIRQALENVQKTSGSKKTSTSSSSSSSSGKSSGSNKKSGSSKNTKKAIDKFKKWAEKLFDWAEVRLARLQTITNSWLLKASEAIGYIAKNNELANAIESVGDQIEATSKAYDLYIKEANAVAKKGKLSSDIVKKIQQGDISIKSYSKDTQEKIKEYQKWWITLHYMVTYN